MALIICQSVFCLLIIINNLILTFYSPASVYCHIFGNIGHHFCTKQEQGILLPLVFISEMVASDGPGVFRLSISSGRNSFGAMVLGVSLPPTTQVSAPRPKTTTVGTISGDSIFDE